jgi:DNA-binding transcriptional LysR family regulator
MNMTIFDIDALRTIVAGDDLKSFARAAARLGRSQSAISMQLKKLEEQAGRPLFLRKGRGLVPTEAGEQLLAYARRILALHDEAAASVGTGASAASVRMGLPQDFFEDVMPETIAKFSRRRPGVHVEVTAGRNYALEDEVRAGRLDMALAFFRPGSGKAGSRLKFLPIFWFGKSGSEAPDDPLPLVLFDHPCLFRQAAIQALDARGRRWRAALTTPSLQGVWAALRFGQGISVRTRRLVPPGVVDIGSRFGLPKLPALELRMLSADSLSPAASDLREVLLQTVQRLV